MQNVTEAELRMALRLDGVSEPYVADFINLVERVQALKPGQELVRVDHLTESHIGRLVRIDSEPCGLLTGIMTDEQKKAYNSIDVVIAVDGKIVILSSREEVLLVTAKDESE